MESASFHDFRIVQELGRGSFGTVYKARWRKDEAQPFLVLKRIDFKPWHQEKHRLAAKKEVQMLSKVRHPNIIRYFGSFTYKGALFICMEFASQGDMHQFIQKRQRKQAYLTEDTLWRFGNQLVSAIAHLHAASIIHRDLKPLNVFLAEGDKVKVGDLGVSKLVEEFDQNHTRVGTPLYLAPEQIKHQGYDFKVDIWALGCLLYLLTALEPPFFGQNLIQLGNDIVRRNPRSLSGTYSNEWRTLVMQLLTKRPQERPDIFTVEATLRGSDPSGASACSGIPAQFPTSVRHPANKRPMSAYVRHSTAKHDEAAAPIHPSQLAGGVPSQPVVKSRVPSQSTSSSSSSCRGSKESVTAGGAGPQGSSGVAAAAAAQQSKAPHSVQKVRPLSAPSIRRVPAGGGSSSSSSSHAAAGAAGGASVSGGGTSGPALSSSSASGPPGSGAGSGGGRGTLQHLQMLANVNKLGVGATNTTNKLETEYLDVDPVDDDQCCAGGPLNMSAEDHRVTEDRGGRGTASHGRGEGTLLAGSSSAGTSASRVGNLHASCPSGSAVAAGSGAATASASATTTTSHLLQSHDLAAGNQQQQQRQNILASASRPSSGTAAASGNQQVSCSVVHHPREAWGNSSSSTSVSTSRRMLSSSGTTIIPKKLSAGFSRGPGVGGGGTAAGAGAASGEPGRTTPSASGGRIVTHHGGAGQLLHDRIAETQPDPPDYSGSGGGATGATGGTAPGQHIMPRRPRPSTAVEHLERYKVVPAPSSHGAARTEGAFSASTAAPPGGPPSSGAPSAPLAGAQQQDADAASSCSTAAVTHSTLSSSAAAAPARTAFGVGTTLKTGSRITRPWSAMHRPSVQKPLHLFHAQPVLCNEGVLVTTTSTACSGGGCGTTAGSSTSGANATAAAVCGGGGTSTSTAVPILVATTTVAVGKAKKTRISVHDL
eukprot:CAMPEP_0179004328 /NCGR_PEP_ID=MMETSP0795-20121207/13233_1 /TAXON_ID=88552 /ORGANISM="Amoebophrya sp., Strain Ameob2" /LENGTH=934 /DNA_ID=CAMNT_0020698557 /DNA_START=391 /DNA_END=3195 /DNA_ORIENTATION=+